MLCICPDDGRYGEDVDPLRDFLSDHSEITKCADIQLALLETRVEFGQATTEKVEEVRRAIPKINTSNVKLIEDNVTKHDQLALIEELGRHISLETKALLHPGTTSYDILDTARAYLFRKAWKDFLRPEAIKVVSQFADIGERYLDVVQVGRTHLQDTSPVSFGGVLAGYSARLAERTQRADEAFARLKGKIAGIVGTGAGLELAIGEGRSLEFERAVLKKFGLEPDYAATQIVQKETLADVGNSLTTLFHVLGDFANDMRILYSSAIREVGSKDSAARLGGSSADAMKDNPINWENICGNVVIVESGMHVLYYLIASDLQRDLRGSKPARYQPRQMMAEVYESLVRANKNLPQVVVDEERMEENLQRIRKNPSEAMVSILRGFGWSHSKYGVGHDFVKEMGKIAKSSKRPLLEIALEDSEFQGVYQERMTNTHRAILSGDMKRYLGTARERAQINIAYAREFVSRN